MQNKNNLALLHLSLIKNVGPSSILKIIRKLQDGSSLNLNEIYKYSSQDFSEKFGISKKISSLISSELSNKSDLEEEIKLAEKYKIKIITILDDEYPEDLREIYYPPPVIYLSGQPIEKSEKIISIVGSRNGDSYSQKSINQIVPNLVDNDWTIASGGALGVDSMAHELTLESNGKTISIIGSGILNPYPKENKKLFRKILENNGTVISPFALKYPPQRGNFPARNRIISGISKGCIVVQASEKSGALITAQFAVEQGKQVFAIPGSIDNELSFGCHKLIQQGAKLVTNPSDILEEFGDYSVTHSTRSQSSLAQGERNKSTTDRTEHALSLSKDTTHKSTYRQNNTKKSVRPECDAKRRVSKGLIKNNIIQDPIIVNLITPISIDDLSNKTKISNTELQSKLFELQLEGKVKQNFAGLWEATGLCEATI